MHSVYVFSLPLGPIWLLHPFYVVASALLPIWYLRFRSGAAGHPAPQPAQRS
ncbi:hypothetical protein BJG92_02259 [Arthrobacter sp. SO5]|uniref:hypothetical protein n=1 Tax=Arthrobacter sp. SO5 TaxID=1897055 RepID=UPI001E42A69B|nr:hypothetical protein [Arthrobacter sp. SO5]MCB5274722.1 hypothetical protein [Arthrobacter sp. SO5]